jgi:3-oxoacyl-[acyl-carrier-protein] synthase II
MKPVFISHSSIISPQSLSPEGMVNTPLIRDKNSCMYCIEPDYFSLIPPMQARRMSRLLKMAIYAGMDCLKKWGGGIPDGIITGTGKGSMTDTEKFVKELRDFQERALNPTPFISSTYNAVNGSIALQTRATGYNQTFVHRGSSFESALYDAQLKLNESAQDTHILVGAFDEMTPEYFAVKSKIGYWKEDRNVDLPIWKQNNSRGSIAGEGAAFFMLGNKPDNSMASLNQVRILHKVDIQELNRAILSVLNTLGWNIDNIDTLVLGLNGDKDDEIFYSTVLNMFDHSIPVVAFKHLCGEYETSGGFGLWLGLACLQQKSDRLPEEIWYNKGNRSKTKKILITTTGALIITCCSWRIPLIRVSNISDS